MVHPPWNDGGNREIPSSFSPLFGNSIDMMLLYSSHLRRDGASPFLKRHCCFFFLLINRKLKEKHLEILKGAAYRTFCVGFDADEVRYYLVSSVFYLFPKKIKGGQNELVKSLKTIAMTALNRVISF